MVSLPPKPQSKIPMRVILIPPAPQSIEALRKRLPAILAMPPYDSKAIIAGTVQRPGADPKHRFDFEDGRRLIISVDRMSNNLVLLHISGSHHGPSFSKVEAVEWRDIFRNGMTPKALAKYYRDFLTHFGYLLDRSPPLPMRKLMTPGMGVAHLLWPVHTIKEIRDARA